MLYDHMCTIICLRSFDCDHVSCIRRLSHAVLPKSSFVLVLLFCFLAGCRYCSIAFYLLYCILTNHKCNTLLCCIILVILFALLKTNGLIRNIQIVSKFLCSHLLQNLNRFYLILSQRAHCTNCSQLSLTITYAPFALLIT